MTGFQWNFGDVFDFLARRFEPSRAAAVVGEKALNWGELDTQSNRLARALLAQGLEAGDKVALYGRNSVPYLVALIALFKARLVHVNVNYRYRSGELGYLLDYTDAAAILYDAEFADELQLLRGQLPQLRVYVQLDGELDMRDTRTIHYTALSQQGSSEPLSLSRSPDDLFFLCTGGTTGMPKAVMWRHHELFHNAANRQSGAVRGVPANWEELAVILDDEKPGSLLVAAPLMHGAGLYLALFALLYGHRLVLAPGRFDAEEVLELIEHCDVTSFFGVGDAMFKPLLKALDTRKARGEAVIGRRLRLVISSAAPWSLETKRGLLRHWPRAALLDGMGSSEAASYGSSIMTADTGLEAPKVRISPNTKVFNNLLQEVRPGSGEAGFVARAGILPQGYYKDPEKSAEAFREIHGVRYSVPGDWCEIEADGTLKFLGRGNVCINSGGEKIYPQEVEFVISDLPGIADVVVVGAPDERWGEAVTAVVQLELGATLDAQAIRAGVRKKLADYKVPKHVLLIDDMGRGANGKADYRRLKAYAAEQLYQEVIQVWDREIPHTTSH